MLRRGMAGRRNVRRHETRVAATYQSILGPLLYLQWDSALGIARTEVSPDTWEVDTWTDQLVAAAVPAVDVAYRPRWLSSSAPFGGAPSVVTDLQGGVQRFLSDTANQPTLFLPVGSRPYILSVFRRTSLTPTGGEQGIFCLNAQGSQLPVMELRDVSADCSTVSGKINNGPAAAGAVADLLPHKVETWADGTNINIRVDGGAIVSAATTVAATTAIARVSFGALGHGFGRYANSEHVLHLVCTSKPSELQCSASRDLAAARYGF